jgi:small subunit ribosomal protein S18
MSERNDSYVPSEDGEKPQKKIQIPKFVFKKKKCKLCKADVKEPDFKDADYMTKFLTDRGKILPRRINGCCFKHQRKVKVAIKRARYMALIPFLKIEALKIK